MNDSVSLAGPSGQARELVGARGIVKHFARNVVLDAVDIAVHQGEIVSLIGPNGSGKTTLIKILLGLIVPDGGSVVRAADINIGYVPQRLHVDESLPLTVGRFLSLPRYRQPANLSETLREVGASHLVETPLAKISGGEMRRVLLARALLRDPDLLVLDEPAAGVDVNGQFELYGLIQRLRERRGCGILVVSHDLHLVMAATDNVVCLNHHICCSGQPESVKRHPAYLALFGPRAEETLAIYTHHHDHHHALSGEPLPAEHEHG